MKTVTIFGSSLPGEGSEAYAQARQLGRLLAEYGLAVCNGGYGGMMEASARGAREAGGLSIGITCAVWSLQANPWIVKEIRTKTFAERIMTLIERGDAYVVLPGGTGTLAELALAWEIMNKAALARTMGGRKPLLVMVPYWQPVLDCLAQEGLFGNALPAASGWRSPAMDLITTVRGVEEAAASVSRRLKGAG